MARSTTALLGIAVFAVSRFTGCRSAGGVGGKLLAEGALTAAAIATHVATQGGSEGSSYQGDPDPISLPTPEPPPERRPFDLVAARAALRDAPTDACRGHEDVVIRLMVTFAPAGTVRRVYVDEPATASPTLVRCLGESVAETRIDPFAEDDQDVPLTFTLHAKSR